MPFCRKAKSDLDQTESTESRREKRLVVLTIPGEPQPEVFSVSSDMFRLIAKMLAVNQLEVALGRGPRFDFKEMRFILTLLGACGGITPSDELQPVDLWISGDYQVGAS